MLKSTLARGFAALVLGTVFVLANPGQVRAAVFVGAFDPPFGPAFPNLDFRGQGTFFIPDACLSMIGYVTSSACPGMTATSAFVDYYDTRSGPGAPTLVSQTYVPPVQSLLQVALFGGNLLGVEMNPVGPQFVNVPDTLSSGSLFAGRTWLEFRDGHPVCSEGCGFATPPAAYLFACSGDDCGFGDTDRSIAAPMTFTRVPEPGTVGLVLTAMVAAGFVRRRKRHGVNASLTV